MSDKAEILSDAEVDFLLAAETSAEPGAAPAPVDEQAVTMRGDLDQINLADIFQTLSMAKMEGVLRVRNPLEERQIHVRDGYLRAHVPARLATRRLGQRLVHAGLVQEEQLRSALIEQRSKKKPIGQLLVEAGHVAQEAIDEIVGNQIAEDVFALFTWRHGTFEFYKGEPSATLRQVFDGCPEYEIGSLLLEVARRSDEWQTILDALGSLDEVPHVVAEVTEPPDPGSLAPEVLQGINRRSTWRDISNQTTHGVFEVARAARDLVRAGVVAPLDDPAMAELASSEAEGGQPKRALVLLQTLRDRPGDRPLGILQAMASVLEKIGERRQAANLLLEAAQRHNDAESALALARSARDLSPHDVGTLSFLRTVLIAHASADSPELERCSLDLLDALIDADLVPTALEIIEDARRTGSAQPAILMREVRARQKARDAGGAARVLEELARHYDEHGEAKLALETYQTLLRVDRSRKDIQKLVALRRRTRIGRIVRWLAATCSVAMLSGMGLVLWQQHQFNANVAAADQEIGQLLAAGDQSGARQRLAHWLAELGACEAGEDLRNRVAFAEAAEAGRQQRAWREQLNAALGAAAESMQRGEVAVALDHYEELARDAKAQAEVAEIAGSRVDALLPQLAQTLKALQNIVLPDPSRQLDRQELVRSRAEFEALCPPRLLGAFRQLDARATERRLPAMLGPERIERVTSLVGEGRATFSRAAEIAAAFASALEKSEQQRRLDPVFKAAVECERIHDFAKALSHYRELERQSTDDATMRAHFRDRVARNATIVRLLAAMDAATTAGDYDTAHQQLRALRLSFPDVPFDRLAKLPLQIDSRPPGATVIVDGEPRGSTPILLPRIPAQPVSLQVAIDGFRPVERTVVGEGEGTWFVKLELSPQRTWLHDDPIDAPAAASGAGAVLVDRAGAVIGMDAQGAEQWRYRSGDLSGLLTAPAVAGPTLVVGSLDGELRALLATNGAIQWSLEGMPTELPPVRRDDHVAVATTDRKLHLVDLRNRSRQTVTLSQVPVAIAPGRGHVVLVLGERGRLVAVDVAEGRIVWQRDLPTRSSPRFQVDAERITVAADDGRVIAVSSEDGSTVWEQHVEGEIVGAPVRAGNDLFLPVRTRLTRLAAATGQIGAVVGTECEGPTLLLGNRIVTVARDGLEVVDRDSGSALYRIATGRKPAAAAIGDRLWVVDAGRQVQVFDKLR